jgi:NDP-sugar pyrophosphorylase family protein
MQAVILAAGEGQRLRPLTENLPKPMLSIAGKPILEHNVELLARHGVDRIFINTHHCAESIVGHFGDGAAFGVHIEYSREDPILGTSGALLPLRGRLSSTFLVLYGDNLTTCDLGALAAFHHSKDAVASIAVYERENATAGGIVSIGEDDRILRFLEKPRSDQVFSSWVNAGIVVCEPEIFDAIPPGFSDFGKDVFPAMIADNKALFTYRLNGRNERLWWIDSPEDYERTKAELQSWTPA